MVNFNPAGNAATRQPSSREDSNSPSPFVAINSDWAPRRSVWTVRSPLHNVFGLGQVILVDELLPPPANDVIPGKPGISLVGPPGQLPLPIKDEVRRFFCSFQRIVLEAELRSSAVAGGGMLWLARWHPLRLWNRILGWAGLWLLRRIRGVIRALRWLFGFHLASFLSRRGHPFASGWRVCWFPQSRRPPAFSD